MTGEQETEPRDENPGHGSEGPPCPIVCLGASAGGVEALQTFFDHVPDRSGLAYVVVMHLKPDSESILAEILGRRTAMPVTQVSDPVAVESDRVYVLKPATLLSYEGGTLYPVTVEQDEVRRTPIDYFLYSIAAEGAGHVACAILSGTGNDGTVGMRAIKEADGFCLVQSRASAAHSGMLSSVIAAGLVDSEVELEDMPEAIIDYFRAREDDSRRANADGTRPDIVEHLPRVCAVLNKRTGHDFSNYKPGTLARRIQRRMQATRTSAIDDYLDFLDRDEREPEQLFKDMLIGVTEFFRDPAAFKALGESVMPRIFDDRADDGPVRAWVAGCATGEEAYSVAILLQEEARKRGDAVQIQVFASDIDHQALDIGRRGRYPASALEHVPRALCERYFRREDGFYTVHSALRERVVFAQHNVLRDAPFSRLDLVSCRNLLIYLGDNIQRHVLEVFHYALKSRGFLFLGQSESAGRNARLFQAIDRHHRIFQRRPHSSHVVPAFPLETSFRSPGREQPAAPRDRQDARPLDDVEHLIVNRFAPAWVVATGEFQVIKFSERTGRFLEAAAGAPTTNLLRLARPGLRGSLRAAIGAVLRTGERVVHQGIEIDAGGAPQKVDLVVEQLPRVHEGDETLCLVIFGESNAAEVPGRRGRGRRSGTREGEKGQQDETERELAEGLRWTEDRLREVTDELESSNEKLKASNEELASTNEELQSANEELETSKEELQSANEELQTVNGELNQRVDELARANNDLQNLIVNTHVATLFVDNELCVRDYTPELADLFHVVSTDRGRPLDHIAHRLDDDRFIADAKRVIRDLQREEREVAVKNDGAVYLMRIQPYRTSDNLIDGAVLTFTDVTRIKRSERSLAESERHKTLLLRELQHRVNNLLATIRALAGRTLDESASVADFREVFDGRLQAIERVQTLGVAGMPDRVNLMDLVLEELNAQGARVDDNADVDGPEIILHHRAAQSMCLAVHELATNAVKYGALSAEDGRVSAHWRVEDRGGAQHLVFEWKETGVEIVAEPDKSGFGRQLIERAVPYELGGETSLEFPRGGCICVMRIPLKNGVESPAAGHAKVEEE